jgi:hypothetical protein
MNVPSGKELNSLLFRHGIDRWVNSGYDFSFREYRFTWNSRLLDVTPCQAVYLYCKLVLAVKHPAHPQSIYALRRRYGAGFLSEAIPVQAAKRRKTARKSGLSAEIDGSYYNSLFRRK